MAVSRSDVENLASKSWNALSDTKKDAMLEDARKETNTIFSGQVATLPTLEGDRDVFVKNLAAHKWTLAEGGEAETESSTGGSVTYKTNPAQMDEYLSLTRFGETAKAHLRTQQSIGFVRTL